MNHLRLLQLLAAVVLVLVHAAVAQAELRYVMRSEPRKVDAAEPANPMIAMGAEMMMKTMFPEGATLTTFIVGPRGTRIEMGSPTAMMPAGTVMLRLADGTAAVLNPVARTYWKWGSPEDLAKRSAVLDRMKPEVSVARSGEHDVIAGVRAERVTMTVVMTLPIPPGAQLPPGFDKTLRMTSQMWLTDQYREYAIKSNEMSLPGLPALGDLAPDGFMMKNVVRGSMFGSYEIESVVTELREQPAAAELFEIPKDFTEVPSPVPTRPTP